MGTADRYIHYVSKAWQGKHHDYRQLKYHFPPDQPWFSELSIEVDLGYQGIVKDYDCQSVSQPKKKPKGGQLTSEEKADNQTKSSTRIRVEHAIGGLKRYRYLSDRLRTHKASLYELSLLICAGLWNFILSN
ncbi:transposase [Fibrella sp. HMF5405]|uniref:Transposase n=1 Tax=Fibrella forsythiae TaxID=2817061 RepID=A0ABS3JKR0_9BACT|nr:transposase [Fibrella forsythiae]